MTREDVRAGIYCRISSDKEELQLGVKRQERDCRRFCGTQGWAVVDVFVDNDISAADPTKSRPHYERLTRAVKRGDLDAVVVAVEDRLHRQPTELEQFLDLCLTSGMNTLASPRGGITNLADPDAIMLLRIKGSMAAREVAVLRSRVTRKHQEIAEAGKWHGGPRPFGYTYDKGTKRLEIVKHEAELIEEAARRVLAGEASNTIAKDWNARGIPTPQGGVWSSGSVTKGVKKPAVAGWREHAGALYKAEWSPILDQATWEQACAVLSDPARRGRPIRSDSWPLRGVLTCAHCDSPLVSHNNQGRDIYACKKTPTNQGACGGVATDRAHTESLIFELVQLAADNPALANIVRAEREEDESEARRLVMANAADNQTLDELSEDYYTKRRITRNVFEKQTSAAQQRIGERTARLAELRGTSVLDRLGGQIAEQWDTFTNDERRTLVLAVLDGVKVGPAKRGNRFDAMRLSVTGWRYENLERSPELARQFAPARFTVKPGSYTVKDVGTITLDAEQAAAWTEAEREQYNRSVNTLPVPVAIGILRALPQKTELLEAQRAEAAKANERKRGPAKAGKAKAS